MNKYYLKVDLEFVCDTLLCKKELLQLKYLFDVCMTTKIPSNVTAKFFTHMGSMSYFMYLLVCI